MTETLHLGYSFEVRALKDEMRSVDVVASTGAVDSYNEIVSQDWDLRRYKANPIVLYGHNAYDLPIGFARDVRVEDGQLLATLHFVDEKASPRAEQVWQGIKQGSLRAVSVGFQPGTVSTTKVGDKDVIVLSNNNLLEISVVPLPANAEAVMAQEKSLNTIRALAKASASTETNDMSTISKTFLAILSLPETATESDVVDTLKAFDKDRTAADGRTSAAEARATAAESQVSSVLTATDAKSVDEALGKIEAGKGAFVALAEQVKKTETFERAQLIGEAKAAKKLTPAHEKGLEGKPLEFVRGFIELLAPIPALIAEEPIEPTDAKSIAGYSGKAFADMTPAEKHDLYTENHALYVALRDAAKSAA